MAGIIKADRWQDAPTSVRSAAFSFEDMTSRANGYLAEVQRRATEIVAEAKAQAKAIEADAKRQGYNIALREANASLGETLDQQLATLVPALQQAIAEIRQAKAAWLKQWERQTVELACAIAERVIRREIREQPDITLDLLREALELATGSGQVTIQLSPQDVDTLGPRAAQIANQIQAIGTATIEAAADVSPGNCRVVTEFGVVDQSIETQLARIADELV